MTDRNHNHDAPPVREDAVERGEGGPEPDSMTAPGLFSGIADTGGEAKNQGDDAP